MSADHLPPQFQDSKRPEPPQLFEELPAELPDAGGELPPHEAPPARESDPFLRRS